MRLTSYLKTAFSFGCFLLSLTYDTNVGVIAMNFAINICCFGKAFFESFE